MRIGLLDVDGSKKFPNLCLMKLSSYHKAKGDLVECWNGFKHYDILYKSKVFSKEYTPDHKESHNAELVIKGGTGYGLTNTLPLEVEHCYPDYSLYPDFVQAYGFLTRGCPRGCGFCIVGLSQIYDNVIYQEFKVIRDLSRKAMTLTTYALEILIINTYFKPQSFLEHHHP